MHGCDTGEVYLASNLRNLPHGFICAFFAGRWQRIILVVQSKSESALYFWIAVALSIWPEVSGGKSLVDSVPFVFTTELAKGLRKGEDTLWFWAKNVGYHPKLTAFEQM